MLTIVPNEDGEMVAVPIHVQDENDEDGDGNKMEVHMDGDENADSEVWGFVGYPMVSSNFIKIFSSCLCRKFNSSSLLTRTNLFKKLTVLVQ